MTTDLSREAVDDAAAAGRALVKSPRSHYVPKSMLTAISGVFVRSLPRKRGTGLLQDERSQILGPRSRGDERTDP